MPPAFAGASRPSSSRSPRARRSSGSRGRNSTRRPARSTLAVQFAPSPYKKRLEAVMGKLEDLLDALEDEPIKPSRKGKPAKKSDRIYQLKITLKDIKPPVWRRIEVPDCSLGDLHEVIQIVMGWHDTHMHQFVVSGDLLRADRRPTTSASGWTWRSRTRMASC